MVGAIDLMQHLKLSSIAIKLTIDVIDLHSNSEKMVLTELFSLVFQLPDSCYL